MGRIKDDDVGREIQAWLKHRENMAAFDAKLRDPDATLDDCIDAMELDDVEEFPDVSEFRNAIRRRRDKAVGESDRS